MPPLEFVEVLARQLTSNLNKTSDESTLSIDEWAYSTEHKVYLVILQIGSVLGILGALVVLVETSMDQWKGAGTTVTRTLMAQMTGCIAYAIAGALGTWPIPQGMPQWGASGNSATCDLQGLLTTFGTCATALWDIFLSVTYVLVVCYNWKPAALGKVEKVAHGAIWMICMAIPIISLVFDTNNAGMARCWVSNYACDLQSGICHKNQKAIIIDYVKYLFAMLAFLVSTFSMYKLYRQVRALDEKNQKYSILPKLSRRNYNSKSQGARAFQRALQNMTPEERSEAFRKSRKVGIQGMLYTSTFFFGLMPLIIFNVVYFSTGWYNSFVACICNLLPNMYGLMHLFPFLNGRTEMQTILGRNAKKVLFPVCCCCGCFTSVRGGKGLGTSITNGSCANPARLTRDDKDTSTTNGSSATAINNDSRPARSIDVAC